MMGRMLNGYIMLTLLLCIMAWTSFASVNELKAANKDCCEKSTCGQTSVDRAVWWTTLGVGVLTTIFLLYHLLHDIMDIISKLPATKSAVAPKPAVWPPPTDASNFGY
jgi:hypothetical protein